MFSMLSEISLLIRATTDLSSETVLNLHNFQKIVIGQKVNTTAKSIDSGQPPQSAQADVSIELFAFGKSFVHSRNIQPTDSAFHYIK